MKMIIMLSTRVADDRLYITIMYGNDFTMNFYVDINKILLNHLPIYIKYNRRQKNNIFCCINVRNNI